MTWSSIGILCNTVLNSIALLPDILNSLTSLLVMKFTLLASSSFLDMSLGYLTLSFLDILTDGTWNTPTFFSRHRFICCLGNLLAHLLESETLIVFCIREIIMSLSINQGRKYKCFNPLLLIHSKYLWNLFTNRDSWRDITLEGQM